MPGLVSGLLPVEARARHALRLAVLRGLIAANLFLGFNYLSWRYFNSINWEVWPLALALLGAETYSYVDSWLFGLAIARMRFRGKAPATPPGATVDVFITCYNEPVELVRETVQAARVIRYPHQTFILDDGNSQEMRAMAEAEGVGYIVRSVDWKGRERHAKAGNLNNALFQTNGEFILILDADQIPSPDILDSTLGYFQDQKLAFVQTPQWFYNVPPGDPFGSQAPLFYGPIQQGKDGWNAAFFCGSNAVLRREALMQLGITRYVKELDQRVRIALKTAKRLLRSTEKRLSASEGPGALMALRELRAAVDDAQSALKRGASIQELTWEFQRRAEAVSQLLVSEDLARIRAELEDIPGVDVSDLDASLADVMEDDSVLNMLSGRGSSPLAAIGAVRSLLMTVDVDREDEAQPVMPMATVSVTEDMATAMRLHALGWRSVYHNEILARGLAPEDLRTSLQQRLRWAQGTIQVMLRENPLFVQGLTWGQKIMYVATMWSYLSGFPSIVYLAAPVLFLFFGILPITAYSDQFFWHFIPYLIVNQMLFIMIGWKLKTWQGQRYTLALYPLWIKAVTSAIGNVYFGRKLGFMVTSKTRQSGVHLRLIWPQMATMALLVLGIIVGYVRLAFGLTDDYLAITLNSFWAGYDILALSVVLQAAAYRPADDTETETLTNGLAASGARGRAGG